jgi:hypothetical protein
MSQSLSSFADLLRSVERSAVHLELRDAYGMGNEAAGFEAWRRGHRLDPNDRASWWRPWLDLVQEVTAKGVLVRRARVITEPASEYIRYEHSFTFTNVAAGEEVRWLPRAGAAELTLPEHDFWLFDGRLVQFNVFDDNGRWIRTDQTEEPTAVGACVTAFDEVWERAIPHENYSI